MKFETYQREGREYRLLKMPPMQGGRFAARVAKCIAPAFAAVDQAAIKKLLGAAKGGSDEKASLAAQLDDMGPIISALAGGIAGVDVDSLYDLAMQALKHEFYAGDKKLSASEHEFNQWFDEHQEDMLLVCAWAIKVNCAGFFGLGGKA